MRKKVSTGATAITHSGKSTPSLIAEALLMIIAMVPGPAVLGMASGTKAMFGESCFFISSVLFSTMVFSSACG